MNEDTIFQKNAALNEETFLQNDSPLNEETKIGDMESAEQAAQPEKPKSNSPSWAAIGIGGISAILMGGGLAYAGSVYANNHQSTPEATPASDGGEDNPTSEPADTSLLPEEGIDVHIHHHFDSTAPLASIGNDMSFGEAFAAAREQVGPGGVFCWHGGVYNTFTAEEWNAMTPAEHTAFAHSVPVVQPASEIAVLPTTDNPDVIIGESSRPDNPDVMLAGGDHVIDQGPDVHVVGYETVDGHLVTAFDVTANGEADFALIDVDDSLSVTDSDILIGSDGTASTIEDLTVDQDIYTDSADDAIMDNPELNILV